MTTPSTTNSCSFKTRRGQRGVAVVEFALVVMLLLIVLSGTIEFGKSFWYYNSLTRATRDGARMMSLAEEETLTAVVPLAQDTVVHVATAAGVPGLARGNVAVTCLNASFATVACQDGVSPVYVRVAITGYSMKLGGWMALFGPDGSTSSQDIAVGPHTVMPYLP